MTIIYKTTNIIIIITLLMLANTSLVLADDGATTTPDTTPPTATSTPDISPDTSPVPTSTPDMSPDTSPDISPDVSPDTSPAPTSTPDTTPDMSSDTPPTATSTTEATTTPTSTQDLTSPLPPPTPSPEPEKPKDSVPPQAITDLRVQQAGVKSADIIWTAPFDNNEVTGYDVRISLTPITESSWSAAIQLPGGSAPHKAGEKEVVTLGDLPRNATIYAAVRSYDSSGNISGLSNVIQVTTRGSPQDRNPSESNMGANSLSTDSTGSLQADSGQKPLSPVNSGIVRMVLQKVGTSVSVPEDLIFVNFINQNTGVSLGGAATNGILAMALPAGTYTVKLILPPQFVVADILPTFEVRDGADIDLGVIRLTSTANDLTASMDQPKGVGKALAFIIKLLFEILKQLKEISGKLR